ncbi:sodium/chloride dependent transporter [Holotrichia oblita]|uniref:Sodium/chloride dependent transporter n=1 Tax=Holotrichia oblita TaxID=644536 RepID=A0ACB9TQ19_HOLOL|nr:sodium/chloride dependent transporter [Holotrichia oblita]
MKTKASREGRQVEARFRAQAEKAYERYKISKELEETQRLKRKAAEMENYREKFSDAKGMYIIGTGQEDSVMDEESISSLITFAGVKDGLSKGMKKFFKHMYSDTRFELKWQEFMCITFYLQVPISYMVRHITMIYKWGALLVLIVYVVIGIFIAMPVYMLLMFLGNYGRKSYIKFWECVPVLKGVAYAVIIMTVVQEVSNATIACMFVDYFVATIPAKSTPWYNCNFVKGSEESWCYAEAPEGGYNVSCCSDKYGECSRTDSYKSFNYSAYHYFKHHVMVFRTNSNNSMADLQTIIVINAFWAIVLFVLLIGLKKVRVVMTVLNVIVLAALFVAVTIISLHANKYGMFAELKSNFDDVLNYKFWVEVATYSLQRELAGDVITFSAMSSPGISTTVDTVCIYTMKFLFLSLLTVWTSIGLKIVQNFYKISDPRCLYVDGFTVMFGIFPELPALIGFPKTLLLTYLVVIIYWSFSVTVYTLNSLVGAVYEEYPRIVKFKFLVCGILCVGCCVFNLLVVHSNIEGLYEIFFTEHHVEMKVILVFSTLLGIYLYSLNRLSNDYHFTYGQKLNTFWIYGVKIAMMLVVGLVLLRTFSHAENITLWELVPTILMITPIIIGSMVTFLNYQTGKRTTWISPDPLWGPPDMVHRRARHRFDPKRDLRYKSALQNCKHACLLRATSLANEVKYWRNKRFAQYGVKID